MAALNLNAIADNASRLGMRLQETISERTRDLSISRGAASTYLENADDKTKNIRKQLDSSSDREKLDAMKRLIALISKGRNVSEYFAQVVKNVASHNLEIRKLVYIYLLRYAEQEPDLALLSINTFQKDLSDSSPLIRAMALRVLSGIKVSMIGGIVVLAVKKCAADISPYVRKAAALAIPKVYSLDESHQPEMIKIIESLLRDQSPLSLGSVAIAFEAVCPTRLDLLHQHYRRFCRTLLDMDEWGQADLLNLLIRYARTMLPRPIVDPADVEVDHDLQLLLTSVEPLLQSNNPAVVLAVARVFYYLGPPSDLTKIVQPLLRLLHCSPEVARVVLLHLTITAPRLSDELGKHYARFLVRADDSRQVKKDKVRLLRAVINNENYPTLLREFISYAEDADDELVADAMRAIGYCARIVPEATQQCLTALMSFIESKHDVVVANAILVLKSLVQIRLQQQATSAFPSSTTHSPLAIISRLARRIEEIRHPKARACVLWLVGQYAASSEPPSDPARFPCPEGIIPWAPDVLRKVAKSFGQETPVVKLQIVTLAAKILVLCPADRTLGLLVRYVLALTRYDLNYDVRDRGRTLGSLLAGVAPDVLEVDTPRDELGGVVLRREQVKMVLFEGKVNAVEDVAEADEHARFGTLSAVTGRGAGDDSYLPDWLEEGIDPVLRDNEAEIAQAAAALQPTAISSQSLGPASRAAPVVLTPTGMPSPSGSLSAPPSKAAYLDLDKFYEDTDEAEEEDESGSEEEEEDEDDAESGSGSEEGSGDEEGSESGEEETVDGKESASGAHNVR